MTLPDVVMREAQDEDLDELQALREAAFAPVFASFRSILGDRIADVAQARADEEQAEYLASLYEPDSKWELYVAQASDVIVGFVAVRLDEDARVGEIGLNAVHPKSSGGGIGTAMYKFALDRMKEVGIRVATVSTGGDASHAPARRAYEKAGFTVGIPSIWLCCHLDTARP